MRGAMRRVTETINIVINQSSRAWRGRDVNGRNIVARAA